MMGACFTRNMYTCLQGIKHCTNSVILLEHINVVFTVFCIVCTVFCVV
jgi:hypothetical protein